MPDIVERARRYVNCRNIPQDLLPDEVMQEEGDE